MEMLGEAADKGCQNWMLDWRRRFMEQREKELYSKIRHYFVTLAAF